MSGAVRRPAEDALRLVRVFSRSTPTQSPRVLHNLLRSVGSCSTPSPRLVAEVEVSSDELRGFIDHMAAQNHWSPARKQQFAAHMEKEHLTVDSLGELASKAQVQSVLFYHYDPQNKAEQQARVAAVNKYFHGPVLAPMDLDRFCLSKDEAQSEKAKFELCGKNPADQE